MIKYLKAYYSLRQKDVQPLALDAWRLYIQGKPRIYNMDVCQNFQRAYIHAYRRQHAIAQLTSNKEQ